MTRPLQPTLLSSTRNNTRLEITAAAESNLYAVLYRGQPFGLRKIAVNGYPPPKYPRTVFPSKSWADVLAKKMNTLFDCDDFEVVVIQIG